MRVRALHIFLLLNIFQLAIGQSARVLVQNAKSSKQSNPLIEVKWYTSSFVYPNGCNVYRRLEGETNWTKVNTVPLKLSKTVPTDLAKQDDDLGAMVSMANEMNKAKGNGFMLLNLYAKSFQSNIFCKLIGIQYDDKKINWGTTYQYRITTLEKGGEMELALSPAIKTGEYKPGKAVEDFKAKLEKKTVKLNWKPDDNLFYGVNVYRSSSSDTVWRRINKNPVVLSESKESPEASDAKYIDNDLKEGSTYFYVITGLDFFANESLKTDKVKIEIGDITPPPAPTNVKVKVIKNLNLSISWSPTVTEDLAGHIVYRSSKSNGPYEKVGSILSSKLDSLYLDVVPIPGYYYYYVAAVDKPGNENPSERTLIEVKDVVPPVTPTKVVAKPDTGKIILSWAKNKEADLAGYYVYRTIQGKEKESNSFVLVNAVPLKDSTYTQVLPKNASNSFLFKIVAVDTAFNKSLPSEIVSAKMPDLIPPLKPIIKNVSVSGDSVRIFWNANPETDVQGYNIYARSENSSIKRKVNGQLIPASSQSYIDTVSVGGKFFYELEAIDESNNKSPLSDLFPVETNARFEFQFLTASAKFNKRKGSSTIAWSGTKKDKSLLGFVVFRKQNENSSWASISNLQKNSEFEDHAVLSKKYLYKVKAYSSLGNSVWSDIIKIK